MPYFITLVAVLVFICAIATLMPVEPNPNGSLQERNPEND